MPSRASNAAQVGARVRGWPDRCRSGSRRRHRSRRGRARTPDAGSDVCYLQAIRRLSGPERHGIISRRKGATPMAVGRRTVGRSMSRTVIWLVAVGAVVIALRPRRGLAGTAQRTGGAGSCHSPMGRQQPAPATPSPAPAVSTATAATTPTSPVAAPAGIAPAAGNRGRSRRKAHGRRQFIQGGSPIAAELRRRADRPRRAGGHRRPRHPGRQGRPA